MKRLFLLALITVSFFGVQLLLNCSKPLESIQGSELDPPKPDIIVDTITISDTVIIVDTTILVDTLIVVVHDTSGSQTLCSRLSPYLKEIVWMFRNTEELYLLEFVANSEQNQPPRTLSVDIDGRQFSWDLTESNEFITEQHLNSNATVKIITDQPPSFGHDIDICLTVKPH